MAGLIERTKQLMDRAGERAVVERAAEQVQQQQWRAAHERRQEWNAAIEGGGVSANPEERSFKSPADLTKPEILTEAREIHAYFTQLLDRFEQAAGPERAQLREEMKPLVTRENELREEYTERVQAEMSPSQLSQEVGAEQSIGYGR
jgi:hypothetical protein